jgi:hypothetical protein
MQPTRTTARLTRLAITVFASLAFMVGAAHALDLTSAPLTGGGFACTALNTSRATQTITMDILDTTGRSLVGGPGTGTLPPGQTVSAGLGFGGTFQAYCTVSSPVAKKSEIKLGFCTTDASGNCVAAVSAE